MGFWSSLFEEVGARRRQLRERLGDRGQSLFEMALLAGFLLGSIGLFLQPWMFRVAPWGLAALPIFLVGYVLLDVRRQADLAANGASKPLRKRHRRNALLLALATASMGAAAFTLGMMASPPVAPGPPLLTDPQWIPPPDAIDTDIGNPSPPPQR